MRLSKKKTRQFPKKTALIGAVVLLVLASGTYFAYAQGVWPFQATKSQPDSTETARPSNDVDYSGPSDEDTATSQDAKKRGNNANKESSNGNNEDSSSEGSKKAAIAISYADVTGDKLEIRAFTTSVIEGTGTCTAELKLAGKIITESTKAFIDASSSICEPIYIATNRLGKGEWSLVVKYNSPTASGKSDATKVSIP